MHDGRCGVVLSVEWHSTLFRVQLYLKTAWCILQVVFKTTSTTSRQALFHILSYFNLLTELCFLPILPPSPITGSRYRSLWAPHPSRDKNPPTGPPAYTTTSFAKFTGWRELGDAFAAPQTSTRYSQRFFSLVNHTCTYIPKFAFGRYRQSLLTDYPNRHCPAWNLQKKKWMKRNERMRNWNQASRPSLHSKPYYE